MNNKKIFSLIILSLFFTYNKAFSFPESENQHLNPINVLNNKNPGFENGIAGWTNSGGTLSTTTTTANVGAGSRAGSFVTTTTGQTLKSSLVSIPPGLYGQNGQMSIMLETAATDFTLAVTDGTNTLASQTVVGLGASLYSVYSLNFIFPASGSIQILLTSASAQTIRIDNAYIGSATNLSNLSQAVKMGSVVISGCASQWSTTGTSYADFSVQTGCTYTASGLALAPSTQLPGIKFSSLPPGEYFITANGNINSGTSPLVAYFNFWDGTTASVDESQVFNGASGAVVVPTITSTMSYTTAQSNVTLRIQAKVQSGGSARIFATSVTGPLTITVWKYPSVSQLAANLSTSGSLWSGYHDNTCSWARTNASYGDPTADASCALVERQNNNFGVVSASGSVLPAITFTPVRAGKYYVCAYPKIQGGTLASTIDARLWDGTTTIVEAQRNTTVANDIETVPMCGIYTATSTSSVTLSLQTKATSGTVTIGAGSTNASSLEWSVVQADQSFAMPIIVGSVATNSTGQERIERAVVTVSNSAAAIVSQSGSWLSVANGASTGLTTGTITSGFFSGNPSCNCTVVGAATTSATHCIFTSDPTTTTILFSRNRAGAAENGNVDVVCMGPK